MEKFKPEEEELIAAGIMIGIAYTLHNMPFTLLTGEERTFIGAFNMFDKMRAHNACAEQLRKMEEAIAFARQQRAQFEFDQTDENKIS